MALSHFADARYARQSHELRLSVERDTNLVERFHQAHRGAYGYGMEHEAVIVVTLRVVAQGQPVMAEPPSQWDQGEPAAAKYRHIGIEGHKTKAVVVARASLAPSDRVEGPALVEQPDTTVVVPPGERAEVDPAGNLVVRLHG